MIAVLKHHRKIYTQKIPLKPPTLNIIHRIGKPGRFKRVVRFRRWNNRGEMRCVSFWDKKLNVLN